MLSSLFGSGPDGYPLQLSAGSLRSPFIHPSASELDAWSLGLESMGGSVPVSSSVLVTKVFQALRSLKGRMVLFLRARPQVFFPKDLQRMILPLIPLLHPPRQLVRAVWTEDGRHLSSPWMVHPF